MEKTFRSGELEIEAVHIKKWQLKKDVDGTMYAVYLIQVVMKSGLKWTIEKRFGSFIIFC